MSATPRQLPARVPFADRAEKPLHFDGVVPAGKLPRLTQATVTPGTMVSVALETARDADGGTRLVGRLTGEVALRCERCLQPLPWVFDLEVSLRVVRSEAEEQRLLASCEPLLIEGEWLELHALVEDEILLALPMAPAHDAEGCPQTA